MTFSSGDPVKDSIQSSMHNQEGHRRPISTWLSQKPGISGLFSASLFLLLMAVVSSLHWLHQNEVESPWAVSQKKALEGQELWRLVTAIFAHGDLAHFLSNAMSILMFGSFLFSYFGKSAEGRSSFWILSKLFATTVFFGALTNLLTIQQMPPEAYLVGASGVAFWIGGAWLVLYLLLDTKRSFYQRMLRAVGVGLVLFMPSQAFDPSISYRAHSIGFLFGLVWGAFHFLANRRKFKAAERFEAVDVELDREVWNGISDPDFFPPQVETKS